MVRYTPDDFLTEYTKFLVKANNNKNGSVELNFKRYDASSEQNLPSSNDKTGIEKKPTNKKKLTKGGKNIKGAANPENNKAKNKPNLKISKPINPQVDPDGNVKANGQIQEPSVLIRARFGEKKVSCVVPTTQVEAFSDQFRTLFRLHNKALVPQGQISTRLKARKEASSQKKENKTKTK